MNREVKLGKILSNLIDNGGYRRNRGKICEAAGVSPAALSQYISGRTKPSFDVLVRLADFFEVSLDYLVYGQQRRGDAAVDYGPIVKYVDVSLTRLQDATQQQAHIVNRVGAMLARQIETAVRSTVEASAGYGAGLISDDDTLLLESFSDETQLITMNLEYDIIELPDTAEGAAGRFLPVVAANISQGRPYKFLLAGQSALDWRGLVQKYRKILNDMASSEMVNNYCHFRLSDSPVFSGLGIYRLNVPTLIAEQPALYELVAPFIDVTGHISYSIPPSDRLTADAPHDLKHLTNAKSQFEILWRRSTAI